MKLSSSDTALPLGSLVLVTGASGFIGTHIVDQLLLAGYNVRGTVRSEKQTIWTTSLFSERHGPGKFSAVIVSEMSIAGSFNDAVKGVHGIIHVASVLSFSSNPNEVIPPTIAGVTSLLHSAFKEASVKSFVYTSSSRAATDLHPSNPHITIDETSWNDAAIKDAWSILSEPFPPTHGTTVYSASKAGAEKALWQFVKERKPNFQVNSVLPDTCVGEILSFDGSLSTGAWSRGLIENGVDFVKYLPAMWFVDVADVARLHVAALLSKEVQNERLFGFAETRTWNDVLAIARKHDPSGHFAADIPGAEKCNVKVANKRAEQLLREVFGKVGFTPFEESIAKNLKGLV